MHDSLTRHVSELFKSLHPSAEAGKVVEEDGVEVALQCQRPSLVSSPDD